MRNDIVSKVSVIIPIYNTSAYLREALDSICGQTLRDIQIILINDGSTDNSESIIKEYAQKDNRIEWMSQYNQGQSVARNNGLRLAKGEYFYFMDSDDILDCTALEVCYHKCKDVSLDFVCFDAETFGDGVLNEFVYSREKILNPDIVWRGLDLFKYLQKEKQFYVAPCLVFLNSTFLFSIFSGFKAGIIHEDQLFATQIFLNAQRVGYMNRSFFKRRIRQHSTMTNKFCMKNVIGYTVGAVTLRRWAKEHKEWKDCLNDYLSDCLNAVIWQCHKMSFIEKLETICRFHRLGLSHYITLHNWLVFWLK